MVKPCILSDWLTGSAGAMLESNWVRVCELEERSLNVSHCCRRQTDSEKKHVSQPVQWHHQPDPLTWRHTTRRRQTTWRRDIVSRRGDKKQTTLTFEQNSRLPPQSEEWEKGCWIISNYVWWWRGWRGNQIMMDGERKKQLHLIDPHQLIMMKQMHTRQKQTNTELTVCVEIC